MKDDSSDAWRKPSIMWSDARGTMPWSLASELIKSERTSSGPIIVCVLPEPVCPYAMIVELKPFSTEATRSRAAMS